MILINAHNIKQGGGLSVLYNFIDYLNLVEDVDVYIILPNIQIHRANSKIYLNNKRLFFIYIPNNLFYKIFIFKYKVLNICKNKHITKIFSLGNIAINTNVYQILLIQNAFPFINDNRIYDRFPRIFKIYIKTMNYFIIKNLKYANKIFVQTNFIKKELINQYKINENIINILPNLININFNNSTNTQLENNDKVFKLLFLSNFYPHKNFHILFELIDLLSKYNLPVQISITLNETEIKKSNLKKLLNKYPNLIKNIGRVNSLEIESTYNSHDALFLPSIVESFSTNYIEAFSLCKTILTSNFQFAKEVCGDSAFYFDPFNANDIFNSIKYCMLNKDLRFEKIKLYKERMTELSLNNPNNIYKNFFYA